jgi:hypothetical protein
MFYISESWLNVKTYSFYRIVADKTFSLASLTLKLLLVSTNFIRASKRNQYCINSQNFDKVRFRCFVQFFQVIWFWQKQIEINFIQKFKLKLFLLSTLKLWENWSHFYSALDARTADQYLLCKQT